MDDGTPAYASYCFGCASGLKPLAPWLMGQPCDSVSISLKNNIENGYDIRTKGAFLTVQQIIFSVEWTHF